MIHKRQTEVNEILSEFNAKQKGLLKITYTFHYDQRITDEEIEEIFGLDRLKDNYFYNKYNIRKKDIVEYIFYLLNSMTFSDLLLDIIKEQYEVFRLKELMDFCTVGNQKDVMYYDINIENESAKKDFFQSLRKELENIRSKKAMQKYFGSYLQNNEGFDLLFNLNSNESAKGKPDLFKSIRVLSLGQKVVALLDFIIGYSDFNNDMRPLLIDQPEDNLDNRYIYKNLVKQLREIKSNRQVIIATHNSTIVTNAKAETVIVLESNNENGWIKKCGYPYEIAMIKHIINHLEGGRDSFKHKEFVYSPVINENK